MEERIVKWIDSLRWVWKIDRVIKQSIELLFLGERWLDDDEVRYLVAHRLEITRKPFKGEGMIKKDYDRICEEILSGKGGTTRR